MIVTVTVKKNYWNGNFAYRWASFWRIWCWSSSNSAWSKGSGKESKKLDEWASAEGVFSITAEITSPEFDRRWLFLSGMLFAGCMVLGRDKVPVERAGLDLGLPTRGLERTRTGWLWLGVASSSTLGILFGVETPELTLLERLTLTVLATLATWIADPILDWQNVSL